jgi:hypothetical protein
MGWSRKDCLTYLRDKLPHQVPKSSCVFCPYRTNQSWKHLKATDPQGWDRAVEIDRALRDKSSVCNRGFRQELFVHRSCVPLEVIGFDALQPNALDPMATGECHGMCGLHTAELRRERERQKATNRWDSWPFLLARTTGLEPATTGSTGMGRTGISASRKLCHIPVYGNVE